MRPHAQFGPFSAGNIACLCLWCLLPQTGWSQTNSPAPPRDPALENAILNWQSRFANLEQLGAQHQVLLKTIERGQREIALALTQSVENTVARLSAMSDVLALQREKDLVFINDSNQLMMKVVSVLAGLLFLGILFTALVSGRAMNRLSAVVLASPLMQSQPPLPMFAGDPLDTRALTSHPVELLENQLQGVVKRLESRIAELENLTSQPQSPESRSHEVRAIRNHPMAPVTEVHPARVTCSPRVALTVGEGAAIGFLPGEIEETAEHPKLKLFRRLRRLLS
jgi:hypothetical protein